MHLATSQQPFVRIERMLDIDFIRNDEVVIFFLQRMIRFN